MFDHNLSRARPILPGTSSPAPGRAPIARISRQGPAGRAPARGAWLLQFEPVAPSRLDPLTGGTLSSDPYAQIRLNFPTLQSAIGFAERRGWRYVVSEPWPGPSRPRFAAEATAWPMEDLMVEAERSEAPADSARAPERRDPVDEALVESFPASDPPSWTLGRAATARREAPSPR